MQIFVPGSGTNNIEGVISSVFNSWTSMNSSSLQVFFQTGPPRQADCLTPPPVHYIKEEEEASRYVPLPKASKLPAFSAYYPFSCLTSNMEAVNTKSLHYDSTKKL